MARAGRRARAHGEGAGGGGLKARAVVHGAVSLVNAVATGRGATLGTDMRVSVTVEDVPGRGVVLRHKGGTPSSRLVAATVQKALPARLAARRRIIVSLESKIPTGYGLKSSSAISSAVALACSRIAGGAGDRAVLLAGVEASIEARVSITGAYDDACACYYGGFNVTDNRGRRRVLHEAYSGDASVAIFVPRSRRRGNTSRLRSLRGVFGTAWQMARERRYWDAMTVNGLAAAAVLGSEPGLVPGLMERGALAASVSGNGPAVAAVAGKKDMPAVAGFMAEHNVRVIRAAISNEKAEAHVVQD